MRAAVLAAALGLAARPAPAADADAALAKTAAGGYAALRVHALKNGLKVYLLPVPGAETVSTMVAYKVGSCDEQKDQTGLSHYLEHLLFKGTDKLLPGDIDRATQKNGGRINAYTTEDMTVYHFDFASDRWETALAIEADRMRNVRIDAKHEFEQEKGAVVAELKGGEDRPWGLEQKAILPLLYPAKAPYSHPVIGDEAHVRAASAEVIKRHYDTWYHPNNASLIIAGGFDPAAALAKVTALFGPIPAADLPARKPDVPRPPGGGPRRAEIVSKFDVPRAVIAFNTVKSGDPDDAALTLIDQILTGGRTGRLYRRLVEGDRLASAVAADSSTGRYAGWTGISVELLKGKDRAQAEAAVTDELSKLAAGPVSPAELARAKRAALAGTIFGRESVHGLADAVARTVTLHDADYLKTDLDRLTAVTPADIQAAAGKYLVAAKAAVVWSVPPDAKPAAGGAGGLPRGKPGTADRAARVDPAGAAGGVNLAAAKRVVLPNGLVLVTLEDHRLPVVTAVAAVQGVPDREPADKGGLAVLVGDLLDEGTAARTGPEVAAAIEDAGGSLSLSAAGGSVKVLAPDANLGLELLLDSLARPTFPADALDRKREEQLSAIAEAQTQPLNRAVQEFDKLVYGPAHPKGRPRVGTAPVVSKLTAADCKAFHAAAFGPDATILVVVGDIAPADVAARVTKLTEAWKPLGTKPPAPPALPTRAGPLTTIIPDPTAAQTHVFIGHAGVTRADPDYYTLLVLDNVLGTGPGFTDRLSANLRDRQGLAYTVTAQITGSATDQVGTFTGYIGTFADKYGLVRDGFLHEFDAVRTDLATPAEVDAAKQYLLGSLPFKVDTTAAVAGQLLAAERYGLGFDFLTGYRAKVAAVTPEMVRAAARKHLDPAKLVTVAVGPLDAAGKPLAAEKRE